MQILSFRLNPRLLDFNISNSILEHERGVKELLSHLIQVVGPKSRGAAYFGKRQITAPFGPFAICPIKHPPMSFWSGALSPPPSLETHFLGGMGVGGEGGRKRGKKKSPS